MRRGIFFFVGVILFTSQLTGKFYWSASMPASVPTAHSDSHGHLGNYTHITRLSLDKRYDLATVFDLPSPIIRATRYHAGASPVLSLHAGDLLRGTPALPLLRGPPSRID